MKELERDEVHEFALAMEERLASKDEKRGVDSWKKQTPGMLYRDIHRASEELREAIIDKDEKLIARRLVDVANYAMMIADVSGMLKPRVKP